MNAEVPRQKTRTPPIASAHVPFSQVIGVSKPRVFTKMCIRDRDLCGRRDDAPLWVPHPIRKYHFKLLADTFLCLRASVSQRKGVLA